MTDDEIRSMAQPAPHELMNMPLDMTKRRTKGEAMKYQFQAGDRVVCIDGNGTNLFGRQELIDGAIYTIREILPWDWFPVDCADMGVRLVEIPYRFDGFLKERNDIPFGAFRFRPIKPLSFWVGEHQLEKVPA